VIQVHEAGKQVDHVEGRELLRRNALVLHRRIYQLTKVFNRRMTSNERFGHIPPNGDMAPHGCGAKGIPTRL
jgi:hypothetical protein